MVFKGHKHSEKTKRKMSKSKTGDKNGQWKGDKVGYASLHSYIKRRLKKPNLCQCCNKNKSYDLANKGIYNRDLENWEWLCRSCHMIKDGRLDNFKHSAMPKTGKFLKCPICNKTFYKRKSELKKLNFCSHQCAGEANRLRITDYYKNRHCMYMLDK